ncbi:MAG: hypothetical protein WBW33_24990 [Bryobacteraceae bacterium]
MLSLAVPELHAALAVELLLVPPAGDAVRAVLRDIELNPVLPNKVHGEGPAR